MAETVPNGGLQLLPRLFAYPAVHYVSDTVKDYYAHAKASNSYVKAGLETAENCSQPIMHKLGEYSHQPTIDSLLNRVDQFGCKQLDKIEYGGKQLKQTYETVKPKTLQSLDNMANKIHGTSVEAVLLKTASFVDVVVESLLPPDPAEPAEISNIPDNPNFLERTTPIFNKLQERISKDSIRHLPSQTYRVSRDFLFRGADAIPQLNYCIGLLTTAAHKLQDASNSATTEAMNGLHQGTQLSKGTVEYVYQSLQHMVAALTSLVARVKKLDPEAKAMLEDLTAMIQRSKDSFANKLEKWESAARLKEDISKILQKSSDLLTEQLTTGYMRVHSTDNATIRKSVETIESIVHQVVDRITTTRRQAQQPMETE